MFLAWILRFLTAFESGRSTTHADRSDRSGRAGSDLRPFVAAMMITPVLESNPSISASIDECLLLLIVPTIGFTPRACRERRVVNEDMQVRNSEPAEEIFTGLRRRRRTFQRSRSR